MTGNEFKQLLSEIFSGRGKLAKTAELFDVSERTIRRWINEEVPIPEWVASKLIVENAKQNPSQLFKERGIEFTRLQMQEHEIEWAAVKDQDAIHIFHKGIIVAIAAWCEKSQTIKHPLFQLDDETMSLLTQSVVAASRTPYTN